MSRKKQDTKSQFSFLKEGDENLEKQTESTPTTEKNKPVGRRNRSDYRQTTVLLPRKLHAQIKRALLEIKIDDPKSDIDFSGLTEQLLQEWLDKLDA